MAEGWDELAGGGFSILDGAAMVAGAAVASVHIRGVIKDELIGPGWVVLLGTFLWIALTAVGPFLYLVRRHARRLPGYPRVGDRLWALLGAPWLLTAAFPRGTGPHELLSVMLSLGLGAAVLIALAVVWSTWVAVPPERASGTFAGPWTNRVGLVLAIAWPIQCGVGMVIIG